MNGSFPLQSALRSTLPSETICNSCKPSKVVNKFWDMSGEHLTVLRSLFSKNNDLWLQASENHTFLVGCANGTVSNEQFNTWLVQDFIYVNSFHGFLETIMKSALTVDDDILKSGMIALINELAWFKERGRERGLDLTAAALPTTLKYKEFLLSMSTSNYSTQIVALYLIERVYQRAWSLVLERGGNDGMYSQFAINWGNKDFGEYVDQLELIAEREAKGTVIDAAQLDLLFREIMNLEVMFWDMTYEAECK
jgi:formylaminopyrimidine deformylase / aminopyrimidine aminohydrolase